MFSRHAIRFITSLTILSACEVGEEYSNEDSGEVADDDVALSAPPAKPCYPFDVDGDRRADAASDGILVGRIAGGVPSVDGAIGASCTRCTSSEVAGYVEDRHWWFDIDNNGVVDAGTDAILLVRHLFGFTGDVLTSGAIASNCKRCSTAQIEERLRALDLENAACGSTPPGVSDSTTIGDGSIVWRRDLKRVVVVEDQVESGTGGGDGGGGGGGGDGGGNGGSGKRYLLSDGDRSTGDQLFVIDTPRGAAPPAAAYQTIASAKGIVKQVSQHEIAGCLATSIRFTSDNGPTYITGFRTGSGCGSSNTVTDANLKGTVGVGDEITVRNASARTISTVDGLRVVLIRPSSIALKFKTN